MEIGQVKMGLVVKVKLGHPMEALGRGTVQTFNTGPASVLVAFPLVSDPDYDLRCLNLWFQASDLEVVVRE